MSNRVRTVLILIAVVTSCLAMTRRTQASAAAINGFFADCSHFSVDVTMQGLSNDGGGFDKFRYMVVDGNGSTLYAEDSARQTGIADRSAILNLSYDLNTIRHETPIKNPITFQVIDLDSNEQPIGVLREVTYNAPCLLTSEKVNAPDNYMSLVRSESRLTEDTTFYYAPGSTYSTGLHAAEGDTLSVVYRSSDDKWVSVLLSPHDMVWVPAGSIGVTLFDLPIQPLRIDPSQQVTGAVIPVGNPVGTAFTFFAVRLRSAPSGRSTTLTVIPFNSTITVYGRNAARTWYKVSFNGLVGWVSAGFVRLNGLRSSALPIVQ